MSDLELFRYLTGYFAGKVDIVQGAGGNTSVKTGEIMYIKASGFSFEQVTNENGFSVIDYKKILNFFNNGNCLNNIELDAFIASSILKKDSGESYPKPSMEISFHTILDKFVLHTHSVYSNLINCNKDAELLVSNIEKYLNLPVNYVKYVTPGNELAFEIMKEFQRKRSEIIFLKNHGIIIHSNNFERCIELHGIIDSYCRKIFNVKAFELPLFEMQNNKIIISSDFMPEEFQMDFDLNCLRRGIFPDQFVFLNDKLNKGEIRMNEKAEVQIDYISILEGMHCLEILTAWKYIFNNLKNDGSIEYICEVEQNKLENLPDELFRKKKSREQ